MSALQMSRSIDLEEHAATILSRIAKSEQSHDCVSPVFALHRVHTKHQSCGRKLARHLLVTPRDPDNTACNYGSYMRLELKIANNVNCAADQD